MVVATGGQHHVTRLDIVQGNRGEVGTRSDVAARDDGDCLTSSDELVLVLDGLYEGAVGCRAAVRTGVDSPEGVPVLVGHAGDGLVGDVVEGDRFLARQAVVERDQQQPGLVVQDRHVQLAGGERQPRHHRVYAVIEQGRAWFVPGKVQGPDVGVGVLAAQVAHCRGDDEVGGVPDGDQARPGGCSALSFAGRGVRVSVVRLAPSVHSGEADKKGFVPSLIGLARAKGVSAYVGDGSNRWSAVHQLDAARLFRLALESAPAGARLHGAAEEGVPFRDIAGVIGAHVSVPVTAISAEEAEGHFSWLAHFVSVDNPTSSALTREQLGWQPVQPGLIADLEEGHYFKG